MFAIVPWCCSQNFGVRCTAMAAIRLIRTQWHQFGDIESADFDLITSIANGPVGEPSGNLEKTVAILMNDFFFAHLHVVKDLNFETLFVAIPEKTGMNREELAMNWRRNPFFEQMESILTSVDPRCKSFLIGLLTPGRAEVVNGATYWKGKEKPVNEVIATTGSALDGDTPYQKKLVTLSDIFYEMGLDDSSDGRVIAKSSSSDQPQFLLIASLIDKAQNLGGRFILLLI